MSGNDTGGLPYYPLFLDLMHVPALQGWQGKAMDIAEYLYKLGYRKPSDENYILVGGAKCYCTEEIKNEQ